MIVMSDYSYSEFFSPLVLPESRIFVDPSRIGNLYNPSVDEIRQPELLIDGGKVDISVGKECVPCYAEIVKNGFRAKLRRLVTMVQGQTCQNMGESIIYDARYVDNSNPAHLIHDHLATLCFIQKRLSFSKSDIIILLNNAAPGLAIRFFETLGYSTLCTDNSVSGNLIKVEVTDSRYLLPFISSVDFDGWVCTEQSRVFISRKNTRKISNEDSVYGVLKEFGFQRYYFEEISLVEQWSLVKNSSYVCAIHGAALGALAFKAFKPQSDKFGLIEIFSPGLVVDVYRKYMAILGGEWVGCRGKLTPDLIRDIDNLKTYRKHVFDDFFLHPSVVTAALESFVA